jgi:acetoacetyl-CoA synthetase
MKAVKQPVWTPSPESVSHSNMTSFMRFVNKKRGIALREYNQLYHWSINEPALFWESLWDFAAIIHSKKYSSVLQGSDIRKAVWFKDAQLNFAENLLRIKSDKKAIIYWTENKAPLSISYNQLYKSVSSLAHAFKSIGLQKDDRVAAFISNRPEAIIAMLAAASIGAIWSSCSPDFGFEGVLERFGQIKPKILVAVNGYSYNGKIVNLNGIIEKIEGAIPEIEKIVMIPQIESPVQLPGNKTIWWHNFLTKTPQVLIFEQLPFDHPLYIMYSSGTTGKPKCIVHGAGGTLLQHIKELQLHSNLKEDDTITYYTTCGWMMWNWLVSALASGSTLFLYDGSPSYPDLGILFKAVQEEKINILGTSPKFLSACAAAGLKPATDYNLSSLKTILSTGSPLSDADFDYVYNEVKNDVQLASISGGTDIISCFMLGNPNLPVYKGELQCRGLGMKVETFNASGESVIDEVGELVCTAPFPSRPVYFWNDEDGQKYKNAYFDYYEGVWRHGDYVKITSQGGCTVYGRSDATLNPGGIRIGTAEIYGPVEALPEIIDSIVVGQQLKNDIAIILFVVLAKGIKLDEILKTKIKKTLREQRSPRHVPSEILEVKDIPRTLNGKKVEITVSKIINGEQISNKDALLNPGSLDEFADIAQQLKQRAAIR